MAKPRQRIAIIGAGLSGALGAAQLLRRAPGAVELVLVEHRAGAPGRGIAYGTAESRHLLNVPAARMSALPEEPGHFLAWLRERQPWADEWTFAPRTLFGQYVGETLAGVAAAAGIALEPVRAEAVALEADARGVRASLSDGNSLEADRAILALGNPPPIDPPGLEAELRASGRYVADVWATGALDGIGPDDPVLALGTGLTFADMLISLASRGHRGTVHAISRHGLLPQAHVPGQAAPAPYAPERLAAASGSVLGILRLLREGARERRDWRSAVDALRPASRELWQSLPLREKRRFASRFRTYWDVHRHRVAPEIGEMLLERLRSGRLRVHAGRIRAVGLARGMAFVEARESGTGAGRIYRGVKVLNCLGPSHDWSRSGSMLVADLFRSGLARSHALGVGLDVGPDGALIASDGTASRRLFTLGPPCLGQLWETTAVPEIRGQAAALARLLLETP